MITKRFYAKIICALVLGLVCTVAFIKHDNRFLDLAHETMVTVFKKNYGADFCAESCTIHPISLSVTFNNVRVRPLDNALIWRWNAKSITFRCNPLSYLYNRSIQLYITLDLVKMHTQMHDRLPDIQQHVMSMLRPEGTGLPLDLSSVIFNELDITMEDPSSGSDGALVISSLVGRKINSRFMTHITCVEGMLNLRNRSYIRSLRAALDIEFDENVGVATYAIDGSCKSSQLPDEDRYTCLFKGNWDGQNGTCTMHTQDRSFELYPCTLTKEGDEYFFSIQCFSYADIIKRIILPDVTDHADGMFVGTIHGSSKGDVKGVCKLQQFAYWGYGLDDLIFSFTQRAGLLYGDLKAVWKKNVVEGRVLWSSISKKGTIDLTNKSPIPLHGYWQLLQGSTNITGQFGPNESKFDYKTVAHHTKTDQKLGSTGSVEHSGNQVIAQGVIGSQEYKVTLGLSPLMIKQAVYLDKGGQELCTFSCSDPKHFTASMNYATVRALAMSWYEFFLPGQGVCTVQGTIDDQSITADFNLEDALIRLSGTYNFIARATMKCHYDRIKGFIKIKNAHVGLHKGTIESKCITVRLPSRETAWFIHMPIDFHQCFVNVRKYLYGSFSGSFLYTYDGKQPFLSGFCNFSDVHSTGNIFASDLYASLRDFFAKEASTKSPSTAVSLHIATDQPIAITTDVVDTHAHAICSIKNTLEDPSFEGVLRLRGGKIKFPAHALSIVRGTITLVPYQQNEHLLDIVAQGRIKKYLITLTISGSIQDPTVVLQASPGLSQEQIVMLLFSGTEEESLNVMAPALVMYNAQKFLFANADNESTQKSLLPSWLQPFQRVSFLPRFTDQTGRGGLKGVLEVEFNDRLSGSIEKNFSLSENAAVKLEYLLSDDVSVKLNKGDRSDLGAEVEMRFKF